MVRLFLLPFFLILLISFFPPPSSSSSPSPFCTSLVFPFCHLCGGGSSYLLIFNKSIASKTLEIRRLLAPGFLCLLAPEGLPRGSRTLPKQYQQKDSSCTVSLSFSSGERNPEASESRVQNEKDKEKQRCEATPFSSFDDIWQRFLGRQISAFLRHV